jgi:hypothetical protein
MKIKSDSIVSSNGSGPVEFSYGVSLPLGNKLNIQDNVSINVTGISTFEFLSATNVNAGVGNVTATSFAGDGSGLTGVPSVSASKSIALRYIIADPPLRS